jgi:DHA1 family inner membrane transport protein
MLDVSPRTAALILLALSIASFAIGTGEFAVMGMLPQVASTFDVEITRAGHLVSSYALGVVVGAPVLAVACARFARDRVLVALLAAIVAGNLASALAPSYASLLVLRFASGLPHATFFGVAALVAAELVAPERRAQAVGGVLIGLTIASIIGTPIATLIGQHASWRIVYAAIAVIAAISGVLLRAHAPRVPVDATAHPLRELHALRRPLVWITLGIASIGFGGLFATYTFIAPIMTSYAKASPALVPVTVALIGCGMFLGNLVGGKLADRSLSGTILGALLWNLAAGVAFSLGAGSAPLAMALAFGLGAGFMIVPALQTRLIDVAGDAQTLAASLNHAAFNVANALGAWFGGLAVHRFDWNATGWVGAAMAGAGLALFGLAALVARGDRSISHHK